MVDFLIWRNIKLLVSMVSLAFAANTAMSETFTVVVMPDTQFYHGSRADIFAAQTQWIRNERVSRNIVYVAHLGDIVDNSVCQPPTSEWDNADSAMNAIETPAPVIPYGILPGNHDFDRSTTVSDCDYTRTTDYDSRFGRPRFDSLGITGGPLLPGTDTNANNYSLFEVGDYKFIAINLAFSATSSSTVLTEVETKLEEYADRHAIITSHYLVTNQTGGCTESGDYGTYGAALRDMLGRHPNVFMMLSGHCRGEKWVVHNSNVDVTDGADRSCLSSVNSMMSNYQDYPGQDTGYLRIVTIDTDAATNNVQVETYSPSIADDTSDTRPASGTDGDAGSMNNLSVTNFSFSYDFNRILSKSLIMLIDSSGSMERTVEGNPTPDRTRQRIGHVHEASVAFLDLARAIVPNPTRLQIGIAGFPSHETPSDALLPTAEILSPLTPLTQTARNDADAELAAIDPDGWTPMLTGIDTAAAELSPQLCKHILLLSDGYHNMPSLVQFDDPVVTSLVNSISPASANPVQVHTVSFGQPETNDQLLLNTISTGTNGIAENATEAGFDEASWDAVTDLQQAFTNVLKSIFPEISTPTDPLDKLGPEDKLNVLVPVNEFDTKIAVQVGWRNHQAGLMSVNLYASNGDLIQPTERGVSTILGNKYLILSADEQAMRARPGRIGSRPWRLEIQPQKLPKEHIEPVFYSVLMNSGLKFTTNIGDVAFAGDTFMLTAKLTVGHRVIKGLKDVEVTVEAPSTGKGNWLSKFNVTDEQLAQVKDKLEGREIPDFIRKQMYLNRIAGKKMPGPSRKTIKLYDDGSHGDKLANDGVYSTRFSDTEVEGTYSFRFSAKGETENGNGFQRENVVERYLAIQVDGDSSSLKAVPGRVNRGKRGYVISVTPRDRYGNLLGLGRAGSVKLKSNIGQFEEVVSDQLDGSYRQLLQVPKDVDLKKVMISWSLGDVKLKNSLAEILQSDKQEN